MSDHDGFGWGDRVGLASLLLLIYLVIVGMLSSIEARVTRIEKRMDAKGTKGTK